MKSYPVIITAAVLCCSAHVGMAQGNASIARPTPQQYAWHEQERIQFVCLDPCT